MKLFNIIITVTVMLILMALPAWSADFSVATGKPDLSYHNAQFNLFRASVERLAGDEHSIERTFPDKGTDGSRQNIKLVARGKSNIGIVQYGVTYIDPQDNVEAFGPIGWEVANVAVMKKGKFKKGCDALENKNAKVGMNTMGGSAITWEVYGKVDKDYKKASVVDITRGSKAKSSLQKGDINAYFWVSTPGTATHKRLLADPNIVFANCTDSDFNDFEINGQVLYPKVVFSKKLAASLGYGKRKIKTHRVPMYLIASKEMLDEDENLYDLLTDVATMMYTANRNTGDNKKWYPENN